MGDILWVFEFLTLGDEDSFFSEDFYDIRVGNEQVFSIVIWMELDFNLMLSLFSVF